MKKIGLLIAVLMITVSSFAHYVVPTSDKNTCKYQGYVECQGSDFTYTGVKLDSVYMYVTSGNNANIKGTNTIIWDTTFYVTSSASFNFYARIFYSPESLYVKEYTRTYNSHTGKYSAYTQEWINYESGGTVIQSNYGVIYSTCTGLPITGMSSFKAQIQGGTVNTSWTSQTEINNKYFVVQASVDGITWVNLKQINSYWPDGNSTTPHGYSYSFVNSFVQNSSAGVFFILMMVLAFVGFITKRRFGKIAFIFAALLFLGSCNKSNVKPTTTGSYNYLRLQQTDNDGNSSYSDIIHL